MTASRGQLPLRTRVSPWAVLFTVITAWHAWRGAWGDAVLFAAGALLITVDSLRPELLGTRHRFRIPGRVAAAVGVALGAILTFAPRYAALPVAVVCIAGPVALFLTWYHVHQRYRPRLTSAQRRSIHLWLGVTTALLLVEFGAYMAASSTGSDERFPTITVLFDPMLDHTWVRALFAALWLLGGWSLVSVAPAGDSS